MPCVLPLFGLLYRTCMNILALVSEAQWLVYKVHAVEIGLHYAIGLFRDVYA